ncbi:hypothetical protein Angca_000239 [Angiostrongylus cantonensis]|nr:hypothetical protein Angca_000239 [Angiostrongylus cantonensis]
MKPLRPFSPALKPPANRGLSQQTSPHQISSERSLAFTNQPTPKPPPNPQPQSFTMTMSVIEQQCGVAPNFKPCVSAEQASHALLECCRRKNLPHGCLSLCRYDITQAEVRLAIDRGLCGLFSVAPYLECASQGHDNTECCRHKGIIAKTGPQCEQFCRPSHQLGVLGLQHIVCGNAIGEMMQCHHSGIRL